MKCSVKYLLIAAILAFSLKSFAGYKDSVTAISKAEFDKGKAFRHNLYFDTAVHKKGSRLFIPYCRVLRDDFADERYDSLSYEGDIDKAHRYKVVRRTGYNGYVCLLTDTKKMCHADTLLGDPEVCGNFIVNKNESETTDKKILLEVWRINKDGIKKLRTIGFSRYPDSKDEIDPDVIKMSADGTILVKDMNGKYWRVTYVP